MIASVVGVGLGYGAVLAFASQKIGDKVSAGQAFWNSLQENPTIALPLALGIVWIPILFGLVMEKMKKGEE